MQTTAQPHSMESILKTLPSCNGHKRFASANFNSEFSESLIPVDIWAASPQDANHSNHRKFHMARELTKSRDWERSASDCCNRKKRCQAISTKVALFSHKTSKRKNKKTSSHHSQKQKQTSQPQIDSQHDDSRHHSTSRQWKFLGLFQVDQCHDGYSDLGQYDSSGWTTLLCQQLHEFRFLG